MRRSITGLKLLGMSFIILVRAWPAVAADRDPLENWPEVQTALAKFLEVDRLSTYILENRNRLARPDRLGSDHADIEVLDSLTPQKLFDESTELEWVDTAPILGKDQHLQRVMDYDGHLQKVAPDYIPWNYNFRKKKYAAAFLYEADRKSMMPFEPQYVQETNFDAVQQGKIAQVLSREDLEFVFPAENYIADRMTRAAFWLSNHLGLPIEFHMGQVADFQYRVLSRGGEILAEIEPFAQNYNKIWVVAYPNQKDPVLAISRISGAERLHHLTQHLPIANLSLPAADYSGDYTVHGDPQEFLQDKHDELTLWLQRFPVADVAVIGQLGAVRALFETAAKLEVILGDDSSLARMEPKDKKIRFSLEKKVSENGGSYFLVGEAADARKLFKKYFADVELPDYKEAELENNMFKMVDLLYQSRQGEKKRLRVFSNIWGDEIEPMAQALADTGHKRLIYIGTAGGIADPDNPGSLRVGDLVIPTTFYTEDLSQSERDPTPDPLPALSDWNSDRIKNNAKLADVATPLRETETWLRKMQANGIQAVEVETWHLAKVLKDTELDYSVYLMISDVVGTEHSLDVAQSSDRERARDEAFQQILRETKPYRIATHEKMDPQTSQLVRWNTALFGKRDAAFRYHTLQLVRTSGQKVESEIEFLKFFADLGYYDEGKQKPVSRVSFTEKYLEELFLEAGEFVWMLKEQMKDSQKISLGVEESFLDGTWNPKKSKLQLTLVCQDKKLLREVQALAEEFSASPNSKKISVQILSQTGKNSVLWPLSFLPEGYRVLQNIYSEGAWIHAGYLGEESRTGRWKLLDSHSRKPFDQCPTSSRYCQASFFAR